MQYLLGSPPAPSLRGSPRLRPSSASRSGKWWTRPPPTPSPSRPRRDRGGRSCRTAAPDPRVSPFEASQFQRGGCLRAWEAPCTHTRHCTLRSKPLLKSCERLQVRAADWLTRVTWSLISLMNGGGERAFWTCVHSLMRLSASTDDMSLDQWFILISSSHLTQGGAQRKKEKRISFNNTWRPLRLRLFVFIYSFIHFTLKHKDKGEKTIS